MILIAIFNEVQLSKNEIFGSFLFSILESTYQTPTLCSMKLLWVFFVVLHCRRNCSEGKKWKITFSWNKCYTCYQWKNIIARSNCMIILEDHMTVFKEIWFEGPSFHRRGAICMSNLSFFCLFVKLTLFSKIFLTLCKPPETSKCNEKLIYNILCLW